jgi:hypothetical protein
MGVASQPTHRRLSTASIVVLCWGVVEGESMSNNKPPMTLYFRENLSTVYMDGSHMDNRFGHAFANRKRESDFGPYVHMEQFMDEVERRAGECAEEGLSFDGAFVDIARELAKEIK